MREPGIYDNLDIEEYHASAGISSTGISLILDCPKRYYHEYMNRLKALDVDSSKLRDKYKMGRALHMLVLEPDKFYDTFHCMNLRVNLATKAGKALYHKAVIEAQGRQVLRADDNEAIIEMSTSILSDSRWQALIGGSAKVEQSIFWNEGFYDTPLRARPDFFNHECIIDLKTTDSIESFRGSIFRYGYHRQAAMQIDGLNTIDKKHRDFYCLVVEKKPPYLTAWMRLDEQTIQLGREEYLRGAILYSECLKNNHWSGYETIILT